MIDIYRYYREFAERKGLPWIEPAPLVNEVDHRAFNYSLEEPILREFGSYHNITHYYEFATMQPCIRGGDISRIKRGETTNHMALFHIFPLAFSFLPDVKDLDDYHRRSIAQLIEFFEGVGLDIGKLRITYFAGGNLAEISKGQVPVNKNFPEDSVTRVTFLKAGLKGDQLKAEANLDTFVATFSGEGDFYAGNRFEVYYPLADGSLLEIGTGEAVRYWQVRNLGKTIDIVPVAFGAALVVIGLERLQAVLENRTEVLSISQLQKVANKLMPLLRLSNGGNGNPLMASNFFRAAHLLLAQTHSLQLNSPLREQRRLVIASLCKMLRKNDINKMDFRAPLEQNANLHPWLPELKTEAGAVAELLVTNIQRRVSLKDEYGNA